MKRADAKKYKECWVKLVDCSTNEIYCVAKHKHLLFDEFEKDFGRVDRRKNVFKFNGKQYHIVYFWE